MIELINTAPQTVPIGQSVVYNSTAVKGGCAERHREGSAQIVLTKPGRYLVSFSGNIAVPTGETVGEISLALTYDGEVLGGSTMRVTPAAVEEYFNSFWCAWHICTFRNCNTTICNKCFCTIFIKFVLC